MEIKKYILAVFIIFSLSFSYQPVRIYSKEKDPMVFVINYKKDLLTNEFISQNEARKFMLLVSLTFKCMVYNEENIFFNTS
ncbi:MAG: hypothetical protein M3R36_05300 [Bacteroidota bacterium]|nr:hypothetical protein [Bacteroidota bacterium]